MSGLAKIAELAEAHGWNLMPDGGVDGGIVTFYKWAPNTTRLEVHVVCDAVGRIEAVSLWHNQRQSIAHQPGVRAEAERLLTGVIA